MKPPHRSEPPQEPVIERVGEDGVVYEELTAQANWEGRQRSRSIPHSLELLCGAMSIVVLWLSTITTIVSLAMKFAGYHEPWAQLSVWAMIVLAVSLAVSLAISLTKKCPLCHGPPLHSRRCRKHRLADRWLPFTHRATTVLRMVTTLCFRCMYCGTPYRLFKRPSSKRR